ncbi:MAG: hypothetical protein M1826_004426 [Phylliscum demangeonii]|nr:MAG: hypothetical protein M1826_004426 [Phylliscum demangeonii]
MKTTIFSSSSSIMTALLAVSAAVALPSTDPFNIPGTEVQYSACHATNTCPGAPTSALTVFGPQHYADPYMSMVSRGEGNPLGGRCVILDDGCHFYTYRHDLDTLCYYVPQLGCIRYWRDASGGEHKVPATGQVVSRVFIDGSG